MDIRIHTDTIGDWKKDLVANENARFIWVSESEGAVAPMPHAFEQNDDNAKTFILDEQNAHMWLADVHDVVVTNHAPSDAFVAYVKSIRSFAPEVIVLEKANATLSLTQRVLSSAVILRRLANQCDRDTYLYPSRMCHEMTLLSEAASIPLIGIQSHDIYEKLNNKSIGRHLCKSADINIPTGLECFNVGELRTALRRESEPDFPLLAKEATEDSGEGHVLMRSQRDADHFLQRFEKASDAEAIAYVIESFLNVPPESNVNFRLLIGSTGKITLTDLIRSWVYPPNFYAYRSESPHNFNASIVSEVCCAAEKLGTMLFKQGFWGSAGIDGVINSDGNVYPVLDINPRLTGDVWMTNLVQQFKLPFFGMEIHMLENIPIKIDFSRIKSALHRLGTPSEGNAGVVVLYLKRKATLADQAAGLQTLRLKTLAVGTSVEHFRSLSDSVRYIVRNNLSDY